MKHLIRAAGILVGILFVAFVLPKLVPATTVESLQGYGFYSERSNTQEWKQVPIQYADTDRCSTCHADKSSILTTSTHKRVSCESCHGAAKVHLEKGIPLVVNSSNQLCETCHTQVVGRPEAFPQVDPAVHGQQATCLTCHNPHAPRIPLIAHQVEGYGDCLLCHKSGGMKPFSKNHEGRTLESCLSCHGN